MMTHADGGGRAPDGKNAFHTHTFFDEWQAL